MGISFKLLVHLSLAITLLTWFEARSWRVLVALLYFDVNFPHFANFIVALPLQVIRVNTPNLVHYFNSSSFSINFDLIVEPLDVLSLRMKLIASHERK